MASASHLLDSDVDMSSPCLSATNFMTPPESASPLASTTTAEDGDESDTSEADDVEASADVKMQEKRKIQRAIFDQYVAQRARKNGEHEIERIVKTFRQEAPVSIKDLMARAEGKEIIKTPRDYQLELFERAKAQNTIAVLDTGSGKTLIAVLLLKHVLEQELEARSKGDKPRISFFLVDSVALVFQQYAVLECNLDQKIEHLWGDMGCDMWSKDTWQTIFGKNMVVVCTAEILNKCLRHSFITMEQINLLILDEAHHAKKGHPYARIIKDYYLNANPKPRIFGMTASPVDTKEDPKQVARRLEGLLQSRIVTASNTELLRNFTSRPRELIVEYDRSEVGAGSGLYQEMQEKFPGLPDFARLVQRTKQARQELGDWCADLIWRILLEHDAARKLEQKAERKANKENRPLPQLEAEKHLIKEAEEYILSRPQRPLSLEIPYVSDKVLKLHDYLCERFERPTDAKCIIFVEKRATARILHKLLKALNTPCLRQNFRPGVLIGGGSGQYGDTTLSVREQLVTLDQFRRGQLNCLVSTSVAEEGLDVPECNLVIRFNLYKTVIQYIQSRGRARHQTSDYLHFLEKGNRGEIQAVRMGHRGEEALKKFCAILPEDRLLQEDDRDPNRILARERAYRKHVDPSTGATLSYHNSLVILSHFVSTLPHQQSEIPQAEFHVSAENRQFICEVILPENSPLHSATGRPCSQKSTARRSAAYEACLRLKAHEHLDANLLSNYHKLLPEMRNAHLALDNKSKGNYPRLIKPSIWTATRGSIPKTLYGSVLELDSGKPVGCSPRALIMLTRVPLPRFPTFPLYLQQDESSDVISKPIPGAITVDHTMLKMLNDFTLRIYGDIFNKHWEEDIASMSYWFAPALPEWNKRSPMRDPSSLVDWSTVSFVSQNEKILWNKNMPATDLLNRYIVDRGDGTRRWMSQRIEPEMKPLDPVPHGARNYKWKANILDYSDSTFKNARKTTAWESDQPVFKAEHVSLRINFLENGHQKLKGKAEDSKTAAWLCPQPLNISALPVSVVAMCYTLPSIITRLESYLIAIEGCVSFGLEITADLALEALTKDSDNTHEHSAQQIHVQRGMGKNYERLEFIGDCFLKMATSITMFSLYAEKDEYHYHVDRMVMLCNKNLLRHATDMEVPKYIRSVGFQRLGWYFQGVKQNMERGKRVWPENEEQYLHDLGGKTVADVAEALIGASLLSHRQSGSMDMAVKAVSTFVKSKDHDVERWSDYWPLFKTPDWMKAPTTVSQKDLVNQIARDMGYCFKNARLLRSAFVHPSYPFAIEKVPCYQRLEFLGDSLLDMASVNFLFHRNPDKDPQWLTEHKMAMVSNKFLGALSVKHGFHKHMRYNGAALEAQIRDYVVELRDAEADAKGAMDYWMSTKLPPKSLSDLIESYVGALFVDCAYDYKQVEVFFEKFVQPFFEDMSIYDTFANNHPTTYLHHTLSTSFGCQNYRLMAAELPAPLPGEQSMGSIAVLMIHNTIVADGTAESTKRAKVIASKASLNRIQGISPYEFRNKYNCDCATRISEGDAGDDHGLGIRNVLPVKRKEI